MRVLLYSLLIGLAALTAAAVAIGETTEASCAVICDWEVAVVIVGLAAFFALCGVAVVTVVYEIRRALRRRPESPPR